MKVISYRRRDHTESVGVLRNDLHGAFDLIRAIETYAAARGECRPPVLDMLDLLDEEMLDVQLLKRIEAFVEDHGCLLYTSPSPRDRS